MHASKHSHHAHLNAVYLLAYALHACVCIDVLYARSFAQKVAWLMMVIRWCVPCACGLLVHTCGFRYTRHIVHNTQTHTYTYIRSAFHITGIFSNIRERDAIRRGYLKHNRVPDCTQLIMYLLEKRWWSSVFEWEYMFVLRWSHLRRSNPIRVGLLCWLSVGSLFKSSLN